MTNKWSINMLTDDDVFADFLACASQPCHNDGSCSKSGTDPNSFVCQCPPGVTGNNCESMLTTYFSIELQITGILINSSLAGLLIQLLCHCCMQCRTHSCFIIIPRAQLSLRICKNVLLFICHCRKLPYSTLI